MKIEFSEAEENNTVGSELQHKIDENRVVGYSLRHDFAPIADMASPVKFHHTRWKHPVERGIDLQIARLANRIYLDDRVEALAAPHYAEGGQLMHPQRIREQISKRAQLDERERKAKQPGGNLWLVMEKSPNGYGLFFRVGRSKKQSQEKQNGQNCQDTERSTHPFFG